MGEQPNPWELLHPQDKMSRHRLSAIFLSLRRGSDYIFIHRASVYGSKNILFFSAFRYTQASEGQEEGEALFALTKTSATMALAYYGSLNLPSSRF